MALEHALLVSLRERPAAGLELARRFERSIGFFWSASHQQIYKVLKRMADDGWVTAHDEPQSGAPDRRVYTVTPIGDEELARWIAAGTDRATFRSEIAVKMRGASFGDRNALAATLRTLIADHQTRLAHYQGMADRDFPDPQALEGRALDTYLVLRGGILQETFWVTWLTDYLTAHGFDLTPPVPLEGDQ